eukprot:15066175-Alexandrium_andersonii.AAC.1
MAESPPPMADPSPMAPALPPHGGLICGSPIADGEAGGKRGESGAPDARLCALQSVLKKGKGSCRLYTSPSPRD